MKIEKIYSGYEYYAKLKKFAYELAQFLESDSRSASYNLDTANLIPIHGDMYVFSVLSYNDGENVEIKNIPKNVIEDNLDKINITPFLEWKWQYDNEIRIQKEIRQAKMAIIGLKQKFSVDVIEQLISAKTDEQYQHILRNALTKGKSK